MNETRERWLPVWSSEDPFSVALATGMTIVIIALLSILEEDPKALSVVAGAVVLLILVSNVKWSLIALVVSLFLNFHAFGFSSAVWFSLPCGLAFLLRHRDDDELKHFPNPMTIPIIVYGLCIIPSFLNATKPLLSIFKLLNVIAFIIVLYVAAIWPRTHSDLRKIVFIYFVLVIANSLHVVIQSMTSLSRVFGFAGIMFVDYSALALCVAAAMSIVVHGKRRLLFASASCVLALAQMLTQTRNTWISSLITLTFLICFLLFHPEVAGLSRRRLYAMAIAGLLALGIMTTIGLSLNPLIEERAGELTSGPARGRDDQVVAAHSIVSRMFIWDTAFNAFRAHPFVGIGVYAFPYTSLRYNNSTLEIYRLYVSGSSPHQTHLAVLAETGIIGAIGFIVFAVATLRVVFGAIRQSSTEPGSRYALVAGIAVVYCFVSMVFSDAWLWGQGIVLLGLVLGLTLANWRISCGFHKPLGLLP